MKDQLKKLADLIQQSKQPDAIGSDLAQQIKHHCLQVNDLLMETVLDSDSEDKTRLYIRHIHHTLVFMCNSLYQLPKDLEDIIIVVAPIQQVINAIEHYHAAKLDVHSTISQLNLMNFKRSIDAKRMDVILYFRKHRVAKKLLVVLAKHHQMIQRQLEMSHAQYCYTSRLLAELEAITFKNSKLTSSEQVILLLIRLNFNSISFMVYCKSLHTKELDRATCKIAKLNVLTAQLKTIRLIHPKPGYALEAASASVIEVLSAWIIEERICMETTQEIEHPETMRSTDSEKIALNLSVDQLALLIKLFKEQEIFKDTEPAKLLKFFISNYTTVQGKNISFESLRNKYYNAESSTISHVKGKLITMLNALNKLK